MSGFSYFCKLNLTRWQVVQDEINKKLSVCVWGGGGEGRDYLGGVKSISTQQGQDVIICLEYFPPQPFPKLSRTA